MKLHLCVYHEAESHFESKECLWKASVVVYTPFTVLFLGKVKISCLQNDMDRPPL